MAFGEDYVGVKALPQGLMSGCENVLPELEMSPFWIKGSKLAPLRGDSELASWRRGKFSCRH